MSGKKSVRNLAKTKGRERGGGRGSTYKHQGRYSSAVHGGDDGGAGIFLQPVDRTMVEQISILQPVEDPMPELLDTSRKICDLWKAHGGGLS